MEINMSPNLSSKHYPEQAMMYEQVVYNLLRLVNVARGGIISDSLKVKLVEEVNMQVSDKDIAVSPIMCSSTQCSNKYACKKVQCQLCKQCISSRELTFLRSAYLEHFNRQSCKRLLPEPLNTRNNAKIVKINSTYYTNLSHEDVKMHQWFLEKCLQNEKWCE